MSHQIEIPITEEFDDAQGRFLNYDTYDNTQRAVIAGQQHTDLRVFTNVAWQTNQHLVDLDGTSMTILSGRQVQALGAPITIAPGESWTMDAGSSMSVGPDSSRNYWNTLRLDTVIGANVVTSSTPNQPVDLSEFNGTLSLALPGFPLPSIDVTNSSLYLSSAPDGSFTDLSYVAMLPFAGLALVNGNSEASWAWPISGGLNFDLSNITATQIRITATAAVTVKFAALRLLAPTWKYLPLDIDTRYETLHSTPSRTGLTTTPYDAQFPAVWRASIPSSSADPRPVDANLAVTFFTGSLASTNMVSVFMRETTQDFQQMLDLNGLSMGTLDNQPQPDSGAAMWNSRPQSDIDRYAQSDLDTDVQWTLERTPDTLASSYISFTFQWASTGGTVMLQNSEGNGYTFTVPGIAANSSYIVIFQLDDTRARAVVYPIDGAGNIQVDSQVYDSTWIDDDNVFKRRKGRIGWQAQLLDGDAHIDGIRTRGVVFAEQRLLPYESITPVEGAQLFAEYSPDNDLFAGFSSKNGATVTLDSGRTISGKSFRVDVTGAGQGLSSNPLAFNNFDESEIIFDMFVPSTAFAQGASFRIALTDDIGRTTELPIKNITPDQWSRHHLDLATLGDSVQTGTYRFEIINTASASYPFWVDKNVRIFERSVSWSGRAVADDPWRSNDAKWTPFKDTVNDPNGGVSFYQRGTQLQIRGQALKQNAHIGQIKINPKYAELGRLQFDSHLSLSPLPTATHTQSNSGRTYTLTLTSSSPNGRVTLVQWDWGDGTISFGQTSTHTYKAPGTYTVTVTVIDARGGQRSDAFSVVVS